MYGYDSFKAPRPAKDHTKGGNRALAHSLEGRLTASARDHPLPAGTNTSQEVHVLTR
jgi:hypothetical protein